MTDKTKLALIEKLIGDAFQWAGDSTSRMGYLEGTLSAIQVVASFEEESSDGCTDSPGK